MTFGTDAASEYFSDSADGQFFSALSLSSANELAIAGTMPRCLRQWNYTNIKDIFLPDSPPVVLRNPGDRAASFGFCYFTGCAIVNLRNGEVSCSHVSPLKRLPTPTEHEYAVYFAPEGHDLQPTARAEVRTYPQGGDHREQIFPGMYEPREQVWRLRIEADGRLMFTDRNYIWHDIRETHCAHPFCELAASTARCASCGIAYCTPFHQTHHWDHWIHPHAGSCPGATREGAVL